MLAVLGVFEYLSNVRRLLSRFQAFCTSPVTATTTNIGHETSLDLIPTSNTQERDILLGPILNSIIKDNRLSYFDEKFQEDIQLDDYLARELDACLLEMREIERDLLNFKQRQCYFYEQYVDFIERKDQLIDQFIEYHDQYFLRKSGRSQSPSFKQVRNQSINYEFNIPVSNRFELLKLQHTQEFE